MTINVQQILQIEKPIVKIRNVKLQINEKPVLFHDYLFNYEKVAQFFAWHPQRDWMKCIETRLNNYTNRSNVKEILQNQNLKWTKAKQTFQNIDHLGLTNTVAVVTGQQVGLFGGPLYSLYKAISTIRLAERLQSQYTDFNFVPVFWLEAGDSDFSEINRVELLNEENDPVAFSLPENKEDHRSVYLRKIPIEINSVLQKFIDLLPHSEFRDDILNAYKNIYSSGNYFHDAFADWLQYMLKDHGLVIINAMADEFGRLNKQIYLKAIRLNNQLKQEFDKINQKLTALGYHNQVVWGDKQTLLFRQSEDQNRMKIETEAGKFYLPDNSGKDNFKEKELLADIDQNPNVFTPNVTLRPILQDFLLPTIAYVAGPGEISYAAQLKPLYHAFGMVSPVFYPRVRITLIESKINRLVDKFNFTYDEIFSLRENLRHKYVSHISSQQFGEFWDSSINKIENIFSEIEDELLKIDPTLKSSVEKTVSNVQQVVQKLQYKANQALDNKMNTELRQIEKINKNIFPDGDFQERKLNAVQYLSRYGMDFVNLIFSSVDVFEFSHQLFLLDN